MKSTYLISAELQKTLSRLSDILDRLKKEYPDELRMVFKEHDYLFAKHGWYMFDGSSVEEVLIILKLFNQGKSDLALIELQKNIENNLEEIEVDLTKYNEKKATSSKKLLNAIEGVYSTLRPSYFCPLQMD